jgi:predicted membrane chloride channel (bestrophin family)
VVVFSSEITALQNARGPAAKTSLCFMWLQEFISRETLHGSVGDIHSAILSRLFQYQSDGMLGYHQSRKIAFVPFPFVNAQMIAFFSLAIIFIFPLLYYSFVTKVWLACFINFLTVLCFLGLHEVARELENPYINVPNELPLCTFQAYFNEALGTMFSGYHPDSWFTIEEVETPKED